MTGKSELSAFTRLPRRCNASGLAKRVGISPAPLGSRLRGNDDSTLMRRYDFSFIQGGSAIPAGVNSQ